MKHDSEHRFEDLLSESREIVSRQKWIKTNKRLLLIAGACSVFNVFGSVLFLHLINREDLNAASASFRTTENFIGALIIFLLLLPIVCTLFAGIISLIPFKQWEFLKRVQRVLMILLVGFEGMISVMVLAAILVELVVNR